MFLSILHLDIKLYPTLLPYAAISRSRKVYFQGPDRGFRGEKKGTKWLCSYKKGRRKGPRKLCSYKR